jgi:hypothetical protein
MRLKSQDKTSVFRSVILLLPNRRNQGNVYLGRGGGLEENQTLNQDEASSAPENRREEDAEQG